MLTTLKRHTHTLKREASTLYIALRDPRVPWYAKVLLALVVAYTFSPIDLIPDFIPMLGYLDDLILTPLGIWLALKLIPSEVIRSARQQAATLDEQGKPVSRIGAMMVTECVNTSETDSSSIQGASTAMGGRPERSAG